MTDEQIERCIDDLIDIARGVVADDTKLANAILKARRRLVAYHDRRNAQRIALRTFGAVARIEVKLDQLLERAATSAQMEAQMADELKKVEDAVAAENTVIAGAITLLDQIGGMVRASLNDPIRLNALADDIDARKADLAAAMVRNTVAATEPPTA